MKHPELKTLDNIKRAKLSPNTRVQSIHTKVAGTLIEWIQEPDELEKALIQFDDGGWIIMPHHLMTGFELALQWYWYCQGGSAFLQHEGITVGRKIYDDWGWHKIAGMQAALECAMEMGYTGKMILE